MEVPARAALPQQISQLKQRRTAQLGTSMAGADEKLDGNEEPLGGGGIAVALTAIVIMIRCS